MLKASGNPKTPQFPTGALGAPKANGANNSVVYGWSGRGDLNARPPAPKTSDPIICASIDSTTCRPCLLCLVETLATIWTAKLQFGLSNRRQNQRKVLLEVPIAKSINVGAHMLLRQGGVPAFELRSRSPAGIVRRQLDLLAKK